MTRDRWGRASSLVYRMLDDQLARVHSELIAFERARAEVVKHYQWMIRHDFLPRILDNHVLDEVFTKGRRCLDVNHARDAKVLFAPLVTERHGSMPIEFSVAAYRLGHSMVRPQYNHNVVFNDANAKASLDLIYRALKRLRHDPTPELPEPGDQLSFDRARPNVAPVEGSERQDLPDGRPAAVCVQ